ncbi:4-hydroxythreonine-4-phosphate dehydrogenase PdxA [Roseomonas chloroacetimidivorans]|uniref:4-hydroxythreonine-4-phosphate dehydrogenase PdxA n=1 Tax=Roseomonas chloroacetimidivorans TaxID=1766656 RepID=UPI003C70AFE4
MTTSRRRIALTIGDPNGIGLKIPVKAAVALHDDSARRPIAVGDSHIVEPLSERTDFPVETRRSHWGRAGKSVDLYAAEAIAPQECAPGKISAAAGRAVVTYVENAVRLLRDGAGRAIDACPHSEMSVNSSGRRFFGYPDLLSNILGTGPDRIFLMLVSGGLRIVHATLHEAIGSALSRLTPELIEGAAAAADGALRDLGTQNQRIGLTGINPHAGEGGLFGNKAQRIVSPAVERLRARDIDAVGPEGAAAMLRRDGFDALTVMHHNQGHILVKLKAGRSSEALSIDARTTFRIGQYLRVLMPDGDSRNYSIANRPIEPTSWNTTSGRFREASSPRACSPPSIGEVAWKWSCPMGVQSQGERRADRASNRARDRIRADEFPYRGSDLSGRQPAAPPPLGAPKSRRTCIWQTWRPNGLRPIPGSSSRPSSKVRPIAG